MPDKFYLYLSIKKTQITKANTRAQYGSFFFLDAMILPMFTGLIPCHVLRQNGRWRIVESITIHKHIKIWSIELTAKQLN